MLKTYFAWRKKTWRRRWLPVVVAFVAAYAVNIIMFYSVKSGAWSSLLVCPFSAAVSMAAVVDLMIDIRGPHYWEMPTITYNTRLRSEEIARAVLHDPDFDVEEKVISLLSAHIDRAPWLAMNDPILRKYIDKFDNRD